MLIDSIPKEVPASPDLFIMPQGMYLLPNYTYPELAQTAGPVKKSGFLNTWG